MSFLTNRAAYCPRPTFSSQSMICCVAGLRWAAVRETARFGFNDFLDRAFAGLLPTRERFFIASTRTLRTSHIVAGQDHSGHGVAAMAQGLAGWITSRAR